MPETTLEHLADEALPVQRKACISHNPLDIAIDLCTDDHRCGRETIPTKTVQVLYAHEKKVWFVQFSHDGKYLASASGEGTAIIWEVVRGDYVRVKYTLRGHADSVYHVAWSPDDTMLLTCCLDQTVRLWDVEIGECKHTCAGQLYPFPGAPCAWFPDGKRFATVGDDKRIHIWDLQGKEIDVWKEPCTLIAGDGTHLVVSDGALIRIYNMELEPKLERIIEQSQHVYALSVSKHGRYVLVQSNKELRAWDLTEDEKASEPVKYIGDSNIKATCFGGCDEAFVLSGSEDSHVYIWHRGTGQLVDALPGHERTVCSVCWNPASPHMFASGSDDCTIRVWAWNK